MARSKTTQGRVDYLISLGFEISDDVKTSKITKLYKDIKKLEEVFNSIGEKLPQALNSETFKDYANRALSSLNEVSKYHSKVFSTIRGNIEETTSALGDFAYTLEKMETEGIAVTELHKSAAANDPRNTEFSGIDDPYETLQKQTELYTIQAEALGDKLEKSLIKTGIQKVLQKSNTEMSKFLQENIEDIENYITKTQTMYDSEGNAIKSFVEIAVEEYGKLKIEMEILVVE